MKELISIIVNVYNGEKYIKKCLDSITKQTYKNVEIIIVNDGSKDKTLDICKKYKDKRIRIINQDNIGISLSRNVGIENAKGEYLFFVDSDDFIKEDTIEYLYGLVKKYNVMMATCSSIEIFDNENYKDINKTEEVKIITGLDFTKKILLSIEGNGNIWGKLMKKELIKSIRFEDRKISDVAVIYKMALQLDEIAYSNQVKYYYYKHDNSIVSSKNPDRSIDLYKGSLERYDYIKRLYPNLIENDICILLITVIVYLHNNKKIDDYLEKVNAKKRFNKLFTIKVLSSKLSKKHKIKILLYRVSPKLLRKVCNTK